eukprot:COSAG03_NODE_1297_length_4381_cov_9.335357_3_plen_67_part_00
MAHFSDFVAGLDLEHDVVQLPRHALASIEQPGPLRHSAFRAGSGQTGRVLVFGLASSFVENPTLSQ